MASTISVLYPNVDEATFDYDYYLAKHMPMVSERFTPFGLKGWRVLKGVGTPTGDKPMFSVIALLEFGTGEEFKAAVAAEGGPVFGDIPNFSNMSPTLVICAVIGAA